MSVKREDGDILWPDLDGGAGPARPLAGEAARRLVCAALDAAEGADVISLPVAAAPPAPRPRRRPVPLTVLLVAAALAIAAVAAAAIYAGARRSLRAPPPLATTDLPSAGEGPAAVGTPSEPPTPAAASASSAPPEPTPSASDAPPLATEPTAVSPRAPGIPRASPDDPSGLLERANRLRAQRKWREAEAAYERVIQVAPASSEAQSARVAAAGLRLEQLHDPRGAERLFGQAERQGGVLGEEAAWGLCETRRARGDGEGEARALRQFVQSFPASAMAPRARARLAEMASPPGANR